MSRTCRQYQHSVVQGQRPRDAAASIDIDGTIGEHAVMVMGERSGLIGSLFAGRFRIEALLGRGGFGAVYLARHEVLKRRFALKLLRQRHTGDAETIGRFRREARAASLIDSPHVAYVFDFGHDEDGTLYLAMEYVEGKSLARVLTREPYLPLERALHILAQVAAGLSAAHEHGVIHRDIKPENIALTADGAGGGRGSDFVKILDFGLAKVLGSDQSDIKLSRSDVILGTAEYVSPEYFNGTALDERSDLYSFGVLAFELLVGRPPFEGKALDVLMDHVNKPPDVPSRVAPQRLSPAVDEIVLRCLSKRPAERYDDAGVLFDAIASAQRALGFRPTVVGGGGGTPRAGAPMPARSAMEHDSGGFGASAGGEPPWPQQRPSSRDPRRARIIQMLAFELCDSGVANDDLRRAVVERLICEADLLAEDSAITLLENESLEHGRSLTQQSTQLRHALAQLSSLGDPSSLAEEVTRRLSRVSAALKKRVVDITEVVDKRRAARRELLVRLERIESEIVARARTLRESGRLDNKLSRLLDELGGGGDKRVRRNADVPPDRAPNA